MPDISMCRGTDSPLCNTCYRKIAKPSDVQSYLAPTEKGGECDMYWSAKEYLGVDAYGILESRAEALNDAKDNT